LLNPRDCAAAGNAITAELSAITPANIADRSMGALH
jgi:hypothetical protein